MTTLWDAVLFDRDGTLVVDVPYNGDPARVRLMPGARRAVDRLRAAGLRLGVVTNQSGIARGLFTAADLTAVHARIDRLLGPFDTWQVCPHDDAAGCGCRKPAPGLVTAAATALGTSPVRCVVVGDIGCDMVAATAAGAAGILVPTPVTLPAEVAAAPAVAGDLDRAVDLILRRLRLCGADVPAGPPVARTPGAVSGRAPAVARAAGVDLAASGPAGMDGAACGADVAACGSAGVDLAASGPAGVVGGRAAPPRVLVVRADSAGDVLVTGPAIRAVAHRAAHLTLLCGPRGRAAAGLLPGVDEVVQWRTPWIDATPDPVDPAGVATLTARLRAAAYDAALVFTSFHQSALPMALLLRMAGIPYLAAISDDYPGTLLDVRHRVPLGLPEAERALSLAVAAGFPPPPGDDGRLAVRADALAAGRAALAALAESSAAPAALRGGGRYVVVHPGTSAPARACPPAVCRDIVAALAAAGHRVVVTGGPHERALTARVAAGLADDLGGRLDLAALAALLAGADCVVVGNTGPAHLAAAVGTPVVSLFAPTVSYGQWAPHRVPHVRLGDAAAACRHTRAAARCPVPGHPCLSGIAPADVVAAAGRLGTPTLELI